ncbi:MAG: hypothetical protein D8M58_13460 [Calditrichaeota bacterium]|nr:MAG: hypothetical protein DWQ03_00425 [Calditrichota bacterium]MBL1206406.1 hypothetical protein [Calditrichota bacterium]NOG46232.1 hypothetical protein [Calditrichota bacterium]
MKRFQSILFAFLVFALCSPSFAQEDLEVFGFFQGVLSQQTGEFNLTTDLSPLGQSAETVLDEADSDFINSNVQQLNLFFRKELTDNFTALVNLEFLSSYSSRREWGALNLEEAWLRYQHSELFNIKAGLLIPRFNNLNEIKNRMPLLPYTVRPLVYEASLATVIPIHEYIPERAFLQFYGEMPSGDLSFDYAAYIGQSETAYIASGTTIGASSPGTDTTKFKLIGGRAGITYDNLKVGVSGTFDKANRQAEIGEDVPRVRIGGDISFSYSDFFVEAEYISVTLDPDKYLGETEKLFYFGTAGYNITDEFTAYGTYSHLEDKESDFLATGMKGILFGLNYKPDYSVVIKVQYSNYSADGTLKNVVNIPLPPPAPAGSIYTTDAKSKLDYTSLSLAVSVLF